MDDKVKNVRINKQSGDNVEIHFDIDRGGMDETVIARTRSQDLYRTARENNWLSEGNQAQSQRKTG